MTTATEHAITAQPLTVSPAAHNARPSLALASDPEKALRLAPTLQPDVDLLTREGLITFGVKGSGKSNLLALLVEQLSRFFLPQLILDTEREYQSLVPLLPHGILATAQCCPSGTDILSHGLQVVVDLQSWSSDEAAARAMCHLIDELFTETNRIAPRDRVPCIVHLDEAAYWLPQEAVSYLSKDTRKMLSDAFHKLASRGRKQGLTPFLYTQSISEVAKSVIRQAGIKVLMRQTLDIDLTRYCQFIQGAIPRTKKAIQAYLSGKAIVILPDGSQHRVQFYERESEHVSHTPQAQAALVKFAGMHFDASALSMGETEENEQPARARTNNQPAPSTKRLMEQVQDLLAVNPALRTVDLIKLVGCGKSTATRARQTYFEQHPERIPQQKSVTQQVMDLLTANPTLRPLDLSRLTGCSDTLAGKTRLAYFAKHAEQQAPREPSAPERIEALLAENPALRVADLMKRAKCAKNTATRERQAYFEKYPERAVPLAPVTQPKPVQERLFALLEENPALRAMDLMEVAGCGQTTAFRAHRAYFAKHPDKVVPLPPEQQPDALSQRIYAALDQDPTLCGNALMQATGCSKNTATRARRVYFKKHPEKQIPG